MDRRTSLRLLYGLAAVPTLTWHSRVFAAPNVPSRFLLVFMRGGYDATNLLVPYSSSFYYEARPTLAIARPDANNPNAALAIDSDWALHPALRASLWPMLQRGEVAFIPFAGTDDLTRSHFETQDSIEVGLPLDHLHNGSGGFLGRLADVLGADTARPIAFTDNLPMSFKGGPNVPNVSLKNGGGGFDERQRQLLSSLYAQRDLSPMVDEGMELRSKVSQELRDEMKAASRNANSAKGFEAEARRMARLMRDDYQLGFVDVGGWDTHVGEGAAQGPLANNLSNLGGGLAAFADEMGPQWRNTTVVVISEFGRTFRENGNRGTDHGHGTVYWVLSGGLNASVKAKPIVGERIAVTQNTLFQNRDYPVLNEYRSVLGQMFGTLYGLSPNQLAQVFPGAKMQGNLALV
ncbi:MAG TPA: DUF1501 domain-containing protein [Rhodocyclaceae bacterium]|nr:DUF1501 domain-containing protein [Rhodocyclaceae bacterium]